MSDQTKDLTTMQYEFNVLDVTASNTAGVEDFLFKTINEWGTTKYNLSADVVKMDIWPLLEWCHPYRKEIILAAKTLDELGASSSFIAAAMELQGWKNFLGDRNWTHNDVQELLHRHGLKKVIGIDETG